MSALDEIEAAVEILPRPQQDALLRNLAKRLIGPSCYDLSVGGMQRRPTRCFRLTSRSNVFIAGCGSINLAGNGCSTRCWLPHIALLALDRC